MSVFSAQLVDRFSRYLSVNQKKKKKTRDFLYVLRYKSKNIHSTEICKTFLKIACKELSKEILHATVS